MPTRILWLLLLAVVTGCGTIASSKLRGPTAVTWPLATAAAGDVERGRVLGTSILICTDCHGADLGGKVISNSFMFARVYGSNLTRGDGGVGPLSIQQWDLAVRHGVGLDGRTLVMMPSDGYSKLSVEDLRDLVSWLDQLPPVDRQGSKLSLGPIGGMTVLRGKMTVPAWTLDHSAVPVLPAQPMLERGPYLLNVSGCAACHGAELTGKSLGPSLPRSTSLVRANDGWTLEQFRSALREGRARDGHELHTVMPWKSYAAWTEQDVEAVWNALPSKAPTQ